MGAGFLPPTAPECVAKTSFSLHLEWRDGHRSSDEHRGHDDLLYEVQLCQVESSVAPRRASDEDEPETAGEVCNWSVAAQDLQASKVVVSGLSPLGFYVFRIRAYAASSAVDSETMAASVFSPVSPIFQTLRRI